MHKVPCGSRRRLKAFFFTNLGGYKGRSVHDGLLIPIIASAPKALQRGVTSRSSSSPRAVVWIQVEGSPRAIKLATSGLSDIDSLLKKVKEEVAPQLDKVPVNFLQLFPNRAATQAFEPDVLVSNLTGGSSPKDALYVKPVTLEQAVGMAHC